MKIKRIHRPEDGWVYFDKPVSIKTSDGEQMCDKAYISGIRDVYELLISDGSVVKATSNHKFMSQNGIWVEVSSIENGFVFNNCLTLNHKKYIGKDFVLDMEVPNVHHYILSNGIKSHNSSFILGQVSQSIEPFNSNYFVKKLAKGNYTWKNPYLKTVLKKYDKDTDEIWRSILEHGGSVQHLDFLSEHDLEVFKTFGEISQKEIVIQAAQRQKYIDQSQSLNLMISSKIPPKEVSQLLIYGWENGIKSFYYQRGYNPSQELVRSILECKSCEG